MLSLQSLRALFLIYVLLLFTFSAGSRQPYNMAAVFSSLTIDSTASVYAKSHKINLNKHALQFAQLYIQRNNESLSKIKQRSKAPFTLMDGVFTKFGLPVELKYLAVIESELKPTAVSRVGAVGPWQLMPETAQILGLKITRSHDERTHYNKSTRAAARYLKDLYVEFGDWLLVLAAYNGGPGPVYHAIRKSGSHNFWKLQEYLPAESREHVKKFIATHYYFEGQGGITTLTKAETVKYTMAMNAWVLEQTKKPVLLKDLAIEKSIAGR